MANTLPRLEVITRSSWILAVLVSFFGSIQHSFLPWVNPQLELIPFPQVRPADDCPSNHLHVCSSANTMYYWVLAET